LFYDYQYDAMARRMAGATDGFDVNMDLDNLPGSSANFAFKAIGDKHLLLNAIAPLTETRTLLLVMNYLGATGTFQFSFLDMETLSSGTTAYLKDNYLNQLSALDENSIVQFTVNDSESASADRFELILNTDGMTSVKGNVSGNGVVIYPNPHIHHCT